MTITDTIKEMFSEDTNSNHSLHGLFVEMLKDVYHAEKQILKALPKMARHATSDELRNAFEKHRQQTQGQVERLEEVFELLDMSPRSKTCEAIQGLITEAEEVMSEAQGAVLDAGLVASAQAVEHYEMARYGTLVAWATQMGHTKAAKLLEQTLKEESQTDEALTKLADKNINRHAAEAMGEDGMGDMPHTTKHSSKTANGRAHS